MNSVNIETLFELQKTAEFFGYYIVEAKDKEELVQFSLIELGSDIHICSFTNLIHAIGWCNWYFNELEQNKERKERS